MSRLYEDAQWMRHQYNSGKTLRDLAVQANCGLRTIARWMEIHQIPTRPIGHKTKDMTKENHPNWKGGPKPCPLCNGPKKHSSKTCINCVPRSGANNPNWKGYADINMIVRTWSYNNWRPQIFKRDNYTCQDCGDNAGGNLNAHHITYFSSIITEYLNNNTSDLSTTENRIALAQTILLDERIRGLDNGITLCKDCHVNRHSSGSSA